MLYYMLILLTFLAKSKLDESAGTHKKHLKDHSGSCGKNVLFEYDHIYQKLNISGKGPMDNYLSNSYPPYYDYFPDVKSIYISPGVTSIGDNAFGNFIELKFVSIADTVTYIGNEAFRRCYLIETMRIPSSVEKIGFRTFYDCNKLTSFIVDENNKNYKSVDGVLFSKDGTHLMNYPANKASKSYEIPDSVIVIENYSFYNSRNLNDITIGKNVVDICSCAFNHSFILSIDIPDNVKTIGDYAFTECNKLEEVTIGSNVNSIESTSFTPGENLRKCKVNELNNYYKSIYNVLYTKDEKTIVFYPADQGTKTFSIPETVTTIPNYTFNSVYLSEITIPKGVTSIGIKAFNDCGYLRTVILSKENTHFVLLDGILYTKDLATIILIPKGISGSISLPNSILSIDEYMFNRCNFMLSITIPDKISKIGDYAFKSCTGLSSITFGSGVTTIGEYAFYGCTNLVSIVLPKSLKIIEDYAFYECSHLKTVDFNGCKLSSLGITPFYSTKLSSADIPNGPKFIGRTFTGLNTLSSVTIPDSVKEIRSQAFKGCSFLRTVIIGKNLKFFGYQAFSGCSNLADFTFNGREDPSFDETSFENCNFLSRVKVPLLYFNSHFCNMKIVRSDFSTGFCGDEALFDINTTSHILRIYGTSDTFNYSNGRNGWLRLPSFWDYKSSIYTIVIEDEITSIGDYMFYGCANLISLKIPNKVTYIGYEAFQDCSKLKDLTFGNNIQYIGIYAFYNCSSLQSIVIPEKVVNISESSFEKCSSLQSIVFHRNIQTIGKSAFDRTNVESISLPETISLIGDFAFYFCPNLKSITIGKDSKEFYSHTSIGYSAFGKLDNLSTLKIGNNVGFVHSYAFTECNSLKSVNFPDSIKYFGDYSFSNCRQLESFIIPDKVDKVGERAFSGCISLKVVVAKKLNAIERYTFSDCIKLFSVSFNNISYIGQYAFNNCINLTSLDLGNNLSCVDNFAFMNCISLPSFDASNLSFIGNWTFYNCSSLSSIFFSDKLSIIGNDAFRSCTHLASITLPHSLTKICNSAFEFSGLESIVIPKGVSYIGPFAFYWCINLSSVIISEDVNSTNSIVLIEDKKTFTTIEEHAFASNPNLTSVTIGENVNLIKKDAFNKCNKIQYFDVDEKNPMFSSYDGVLYSNNSKEIIAVPMSKSGILKLHDNLIKINDDQFKEHQGITSVIFGKNLTTIGQNAFSGCSNLTSIVIPKNIIEIKNGAFHGCQKLTLVNFTGTKSPKISDDAFEGCNNLKSINVPYNYEEDNFNSLPISKAEYIGMPHASSEFIQISSSRISHSNTREIKTPSFSKSSISHTFESESVINPSFDDDIEDTEIDYEDKNVPSGHKKKKLKGGVIAAIVIVVVVVVVAVVAFVITCAKKQIACFKRKNENDFHLANL